jgi:hypothetical protein
LNTNFDFDYTTFHNVDIDVVEEGGDLTNQKIDESIAYFVADVGILKVDLTYGDPGYDPAYVTWMKLLPIGGVLDRTEEPIDNYNLFGGTANMSDPDEHPAALYENRMPIYFCESYYYNAGTPTLQYIDVEKADSNFFTT